VATAKRITTPDPAVAGSLAVMAQVVGLAVESVGEAQVLQSAGKQSEAIGILLGLEDRLNEALTLYQGILTLHRHR
jgi:hypothetical protein